MLNFYTTKYYLADNKSLSNNPLIMIVVFVYQHDKGALNILTDCCVNV